MLVISGYEGTRFRHPSRGEGGAGMAGFDWIYVINDQPFRTVRILGTRRSLLGPAEFKRKSQLRYPEFACEKSYVLALNHPKKHPNS